ALRGLLRLGVRVGARGDLACRSKPHVEIVDETPRAVRRRGAGNRFVAAGALPVDLGGDLLVALAQALDSLVVLPALSAQSGNLLGALVELRLAIAERLPPADALT